MICNKCGNNIPDGSNVCGACGEIINNNLVSQGMQPVVNQQDVQPIEQPMAQPSNVQMVSQAPVQPIDQPMAQPSNVQMASQAPVQPIDQPMVQPSNVQTVSQAPVQPIDQPMVQPSNVQMVSQAPAQSFGQPMTQPNTDQMVSQTPNQSFGQPIAQPSNVQMINQVSNQSVEQAAMQSGIQQVNQAAMSTDMKQSNLNKNNTKSKLGNIAFYAIVAVLVVAIAILSIKLVSLKTSDDKTTSKITEKTVEKKNSNVFSLYGFNFNVPSGYEIYDDSDYTVVRNMSKKVAFQIPDVYNSVISEVEDNKEYINKEYAKSGAKALSTVKGDVNGKKYISLNYSVDGYNYSLLYIQLLSDALLELDVAFPLNKKDSFYKKDLEALLSSVNTLDSSSEEFSQFEIINHIDLVELLDN